MLLYSLCSTLINDSSSFSFMNVEDEKKERILTWGMLPASIVYLSSGTKKSRQEKRLRQQSQKNRWTVTRNDSLSSKRTSLKQSGRLTLFWVRLRIIMHSVSHSCHSWVRYSVGGWASVTVVFETKKESLMWSCLSSHLFRQNNQQLFWFFVERHPIWLSP